MSPHEILEGHAVVRAKQQITIPPRIVEVLDVQPGDTIRFAARSDGSVTVQLLRLYLAPTPLEEAVSNVSSLPASLLPAAPGTVDW